MTITKDILKQYAALKQEEAELKRRRQSISAQIINLEEQARIVSDTVTCGKKNKKPLKTVSIKGIDQRPSGMIARKRKALDELMQRLEELDADILDCMVVCEDFIKTVEDSRMRLIIRYHIIDGLTWARTASKMGTTEDSIRKAFDRFMDVKTDEEEKI